MDIPVYVKIVKKQDAKNPIILLSKLALAFLRWITAGRLDLEYERRTTTQGNTIYLGSGFNANTDAGRRTIRHELEHVRQWRKYWILYPVSYLLNIWSIVFPVFCAAVGWPWWAGLLSVFIGAGIPGVLSFRAMWEAWAFAETIRERKKQFGYCSAITVAYYTALLTGKPYYYAATVLKRQIKKYFQVVADE